MSLVLLACCLAGWAISRPVVESFKMVERLCGRMTRIYAKKGDSYWTFVDRCDLSAEAIAAKIEGAMQ